MNRVILNYDTVDAFVSEQNAAGNNVFWNGWDLTFWRENSDGFYDKNGSFRNGQWGVQATVEPNAQGLWRVPTKYVNTRRPRN